MIIFYHLGDKNEPINADQLTETDLYRIIGSAEHRKIHSPLNQYHAELKVGFYQTYFSNRPPEPNTHLKPPCINLAAR